MNEKDKPSRMYLFVAGVISLFLLYWLADLHENLDWLVLHFGLFIPLVFFYGAFTGK